MFETGGLVGLPGKPVVLFKYHSFKMTLNVDVFRSHFYMVPSINMPIS